MKRLRLIVLALLPIISYAQETNWTESQKNILEKYSLSEDDHRGVVFSQSNENCDVTASSVSEGIEGFFTQTMMKDITYICIDPNSAFHPEANKTSDLKGIIEIYLNEINTTK